MLYFFVFKYSNAPITFCLTSLYTPACSCAHPVREISPSSTPPRDLPTACQTKSLGQSLHSIRSKFLELHKPVNQRVDSMIPSNSDILSRMKLPPETITQKLNSSSPNPNPSKSNRSNSNPNNSNPINSNLRNSNPRNSNLRNSNPKNSNLSN
ncbi:hypothetical protein M758_UG106500 [Ceratodon purpureus]|nr:hypothetical protein M758_UG106500 [Ceratodon purpureus]